ncbi:hypothetical protein GCM10010515_40700 [Streptomyces fructofermentans]|uniref:Uncharacterized protein n=1 Tax=Streptomyces fructofermentans TaxID=152141 RepID=A0A918KN96_9ACTN|nr:hypothetical protein GCM10010515_40700 [Streptomyces fructofermentans]
MQQSPAQGLHLSAELIPTEPHQEAGTRTDIGLTRVGIRKVLDLHDVPGGSWKGVGDSGRGEKGGEATNRERFASQRVRRQTIFRREAKIRPGPPGYGLEAEGPYVFVPGVVRRWSACEMAVRCVRQPLRRSAVPF